MSTPASVYASHAPPYLARTLEALGAETAVSAQGATLTCASGRTLVDFASGNFGYGHPEVVARVAEQVRIMPLSVRAIASDKLAMFVERMSRFAPGELSVSYPCNSGSEAIEGALKLAKGFNRGRRHFVATLGAWHGGTMGALSVSGISEHIRLLQGLPLQTKFVPYGDTEAIARAIDADTAGVILEPVQVGSGVEVPPPGYLRTVRDRCDATGAIFIANEANTALGRTGRLFGVDHDGVVPDVMVMGGALAGGVFPMGLYVATRRVNDPVYAQRIPSVHASTTAGNPLACVAAMTVMDLVEREQLPARAASAERFILRTLEEVRARHTGVVLEHAGRGLLAGLRLRDVETARAVQREALARGVLLRLDGVPNGEAWLGLRPPLLITEAELARGLEALSGAMAKVLERPAGAVGVAA